MKVFKIIGVILFVLFVGVAGTGVYLKTALPKTSPAPDINIERTPQRLERGAYLANYVAVCMDCHSTREWNFYSGPMAATDKGGGGDSFTREMGFPGTFYAPNITPYTLGNWTDGEILRAITTGVNKEGKALFPLMAYHRFGQMNEEDIYSIIAYIRTLAPVKKDVPPSEVDFPFNFLINTMPQQAAFTKKPAHDNTVAYGAYLVNAAGCVDCHSKTDKGKVVAGTEFGGGMEFKQPGGVLRSPNITFDTKSGIGNWTKEAFVQRFKQYADSSYVKQPVTPEQINTPMPWTMFAGMTTEDLEAIYDYLKTVQPISN